MDSVILLSKAAQKNASPKPIEPGGSPKPVEPGDSPKEKVRAAWNPELEKTLVDLLHEHKTFDRRGQIGWPSESWNKIVTEFHVREDYVYFTKAQMQEKEKELKRDYRLLKDVKQQSGVHFDEKTGRIKACPAVWKNILDSYPKAKKFHRKGFPLFETLRELYDGQTAEGTYNYTSTQLKDPTQVENGDNYENLEVLKSVLQEIMADQEDNEVMEVEDGPMPQRRDATVTKNTEDDERVVHASQTRAAIVTGNTKEREPKRQKKINLEGLMEKYINRRAKQAEDEAKEMEEKKVRAAWNPELEKTLVDLLHEHKTSDRRGKIGWPSESWNKIVTEFHVREDYVYFTKAQIQEREKELKRDYRLLKDVKQQSGVHFDEKTGRIKACPAVWKNILDSYPKAKKFRGKGFLLFETLRDLYDGQTAEGTYNYTSNQVKDSTQVENGDNDQNLEVLNSVLQEIMADQEDNEVMEVEDGHMPQRRDATVTKNTEDDERVAHASQTRAAIVTMNTKEREPKRQKKINLEGLEKYNNRRAKQAEDEAKEKEEKKVRAAWNPELEKTLVDLLHEHKTSDRRGKIGCPSESWNKIVTEFHVREDYVYFTKAQIQEKEKELKRDYRLLKDAKQQSGVHFDEKTGRIKACPAVWKNILDSYPRAKKFRSKGFPLFETFRELYDGQTTEGTYNYTSNQLKDTTQVENGHNDENLEVLSSDLQEIMADQEDDEVMEVEDGHMPQRRDATVTKNTKDDERVVHASQRRASTVTRNTKEREPKGQKKINLEGLMEKYINRRAKQAEDEAKEKEESEWNAFSIKKCITVVNTMEITKEEKAKSLKLFKDLDTRQIFLSAYDNDPEVALIWLRGEIA